MLKLRISPALLAACVCVLTFASDIAAEPSARLTVACGGLQTVGPTDPRTDSLAGEFYSALSGVPGIRLLADEEVEKPLHEHRRALLGDDPDLVQVLGQRLGADAMVFLTSVTDPDIVGENGPRARAVVVHSGPLSTGVFPTRGVSLDADAVVEALVAQALSLLPPIGKVVGIIQTGDVTSIQLHPIGDHEALGGVGSELVVHKPGRQSEAPVHIAGGASDSARVWLPGPKMCSVRITEIAEDGRPEAVVTDGEIPNLGALVLAASAGEGAYESLNDPTILLSAPAGSICRVEGETVGLTPLVFEGEALGGAEVALEASGHETLTSTLPDTIAGLAWWRGELKRIPPFGGLEVVSVPEGASVSVDGEAHGETPLTLENVSVGRHAVRVTRDDHRPFVANVTIELGETTRVQAALTRSAQPVTITSDPAGASVLVDGRALGTTPIEDVSVDVGEHTIVARRDGYQALRHTLTVSPDAPPDPLTLHLTPLPGSLTITSQPRGASVYLDDEPVGSTPLELPEVVAGEHALRVEKGGYEIWRATVEVTPDSVLEREAKLTRLTGTLTVSALPEGAEVFVDGESIGRTPIDGHDVSVGERQVVIRAPKYETWRRAVEIREGQVARVQIALVEGQPDPKPEPVDAEALDTTPFDGIAELNMVDTGSGEAVELRISVDESAQQGGGTCKLWLSSGFPEETRTVSSEHLIAIVIPGMRFHDDLRRFDVPRGPVKRIQIGQQSELHETVRVEIHTVTKPEVAFDFHERQLLTVDIKPPGASASNLTSRQIALTFDDFPFENSDGLLDTLDELDVRASLFVVGRKAEEHPDLMRRAACSGHGLENHSYSHPTFTQLSDEEVQLELERCNEAIRRTSGHSPVLARAPGGRSNGHHHRLMAGLNLEPCGWTINCGDYRKHDPSAIARRILEDVQPGAIILLHDGVAATQDALRQVVPQLRARGYCFVPATELMGR